MKTILAALVLMCAACGSSTAPTYDRPDGVAFTPPDSFRAMYEEMEACSGLTGDYDRVRWFKVAGSEWSSTYNDARVSGEWWPDHDIYLAETVAELRNPDRGSTIVEHEILHDLLQSPWHPSPPFGSPYGGCAPAVA